MNAPIKFKKKLLLVIQSDATVLADYDSKHY